MIFNAASFGRTQLMTALLYAEGNLAYACGNMQEARKKYSLGMEIAMELNPLSEAVIAFHYKLALVETQGDNFNVAMEHFRKALVIAEHDNVEGETARILRRRAMIITSNPLATEAQHKDAEADMLRARLLRVSLGDAMDKDEDESVDEDQIYDRLVCLFFW